MILFVGTTEVGFFVPEIAEKYGEDVSFLGYTPNIEPAFSIITQDKYNSIIIDATQLLDKSNIVADTIERIQSAQPSCKIIIYGNGLNPNTSIIRSIKNIGIRNFIMGPTLTEMKNDLNIALSGKNDKDVNVDEFYNTMDKSKTEPIELPNPKIKTKQYKTIGIVGSMGRIGTTTQCLQLIKFLQLKGKSACYIELNNTNYVKKLAMYYCDGVSVNETLDKVDYQNIDMFYNTEKNISKILSLGYDYFIYDFGSLEEKEFPFVSYLEKNVKILVGGAKPSEMESMQNALKRLNSTEIHYIFSFTDGSEQKDILDVMEEKSVKTHFCGMTPDPFTFLSTSSATYEGIFTTYVPQKTKKFFRRKNNNG